MTSRERAKGVVIEYIREWAAIDAPSVADPTRTMDVKLCELIAQAIDDAVAEERKRIHDEIVAIIRERGKR